MCPKLGTGPALHQSMSAQINSIRSTHFSCSSTKKANTSAELKAKQRVRDEQVAACMPIVRRLAAKIGRQIRSKIGQEDIISWGVTGLLEAIDRYVPGGKASLETFAYYRIRGAMLDGIGHIAPLSKKEYRSAKAVDDKRAIYRESLSDIEVADTRQKNVEEQVHAIERAEILKQAIATLSEAQQHLVRQYYFEDRSLQDAASDIGISKSWASRSHSNALGLLREELQESLFMAA